jgi:nucleoside-diphosphate-sugar epimerase
MPEIRGTVLVTGASGFVGSHLVERLVAGGACVRALLRAESSTRWLPPSASLEVVRGSIHDTAVLERALGGVSAVFHLAAVTSAPRSEDYVRANRDATSQMLQAVTAVAPQAAFVYCSSQAAAGPARAGRPLNEEDEARPISAYGRSKLQAEQLVLGSSLNAAVVRPPSVYGPRDRDILQLFRWAARGFTPHVGVPDQLMSILHVDDLVTALLAASRAPWRRVYFVTDGQLHRKRELLGMIERAVEKRTTHIKLPRPALLVWAHASRLSARVTGARPLLTPERLHDFFMPDWTCDDSRARAELGWAPEVHIEEGLAQTARWYREHGWI